MSNTVNTIVIGGGISGLTTAYAIKKQGRDVLVLESEKTPGGNIKSNFIDGWLVEEGPNSLLVNRQQVLDLFHELGLKDELVEGSTVSKNRFILRDGTLHALPASPLSFLRSRLFSTKDKLRLFKEPWIKPAKEEETVAAFVTRRLGVGFYDYAINPFVSGVYAGDPHQLSARAATKKVYALEEKHGSLVRGALSMVLGFDRPEGRISGRMVSFKNGMSTLPLRLAEKLGDQLKTSQPATSITYMGDSKGWLVKTGRTSYQAEKIIMATPAAVTAKLTSSFTDVHELSKMPYAPLAVCHLGFSKQAIEHELNGFGCLIPQKEGLRLLGVLFSSSMFPGRAPSDDTALLTCFIGGATCPEMVNWSDQEIMQQVQQDVKQILGTKEEPVFKNMTRYDQSIPQYTMGHIQRMKLIQDKIQQFNGLTTRANWHDGISLSDCILNSLSLADQVTR